MISKRRLMVSVVTPTKNQAMFIEASLESVARQSYPNVEHIVVDAASTDATVRILEATQRSGLRWISERDSGMYEGINKGLRLANGDVFGYLNSDDVYLPWAVEVAVDAFDRHPGVDIVFGDSIRVDSATGSQRLRLFPPFDGTSLTAFESLAQPAVFWRRELVDRIGLFDEGLRYVGDLDYWLRAAKAGADPLHVDEVIAVERDHEGALSQAQRANMVAEDRQMRDRHAPTARVTSREVERAVRRNKLWQRRLWLRFALATLLGRRDVRWRLFRMRGETSVFWWRVVLGQTPRNGDRFLLNAVRSRLAARTLARPPIDEGPRALPIQPQP